MKNALKRQFTPRQLEAAGVVEPYSVKPKVKIKETPDGPDTIYVGHDGTKASKRRLLRMAGIEREAANCVIQGITLDRRGFYGELWRHGERVGSLWTEGVTTVKANIRTTDNERRNEP